MGVWVVCDDFIFLRPNQIIGKPPDPTPTLRVETSPQREGITSLRRIGLGGSEEFGLMLRHQRIDQLIEPLPFDHRIELVEREIDPVIGDTALREIIGADAFRAVAGADLAAPVAERAASRRWRSRS